MRKCSTPNKLAVEMLTNGRLVAVLICVTIVLAAIVNAAHDDDDYEAMEHRMPLKRGGL